MVSTSQGGTTTDDNVGAYYTFTTLDTPPPAPVGVQLFYALDEGIGSVANDSSGNGHDGTLINSPAWVAGQSGGALSAVSWRNNLL